MVRGLEGLGLILLMDISAVFMVTNVGKFLKES